MFGVVARAQVRVLPYANKYDPPHPAGVGGECANYRLDENESMLLRGRREFMDGTLDLPQSTNQ